MTSASIETRLVSAVIDVDLAVFAVEARGTLAMIVVDQVGACSAVFARIRLALVNVDVAVFALKTGKAVALKVVDQIHTTSSILARFALFAFINFGLAICSSETGLAVAFHAADFGLEYSILSVAVLFAVETDEMFASLDRIVHSLVPVIDVFSCVTVGFGT